MSVDDFFNKFVYEWMFNDIEKTILICANYLVALGLSVYTEILGGLKNGTWNPGEGKNNYNAFLSYLGENYVLIDKKISKNNKNDSLYHRLRCGLVHEYLIKKSGAVYRRTGEDIKDGIIYDEANDCIVVVLENYFNDFKKGAKKLHQELKKKSFKKYVITDHSGDVLILTFAGIQAYKNGVTSTPKELN